MHGAMPANYYSSAQPLEPVGQLSTYSLQNSARTPKIHVPSGIASPRAVVQHEPHRPIPWICASRQPV